MSMAYDRLITDFKIINDYIHYGGKAITFHKDIY